MDEQNETTPGTSRDGDVEEPAIAEVEETPEQVVARETAKSPTRGMCGAILGLETIALGLTAPVLITIADVRPAVGLAVGLGLAVLCVVAAGGLGRRWGYGLGTAIQVAAVGLGFVIPMMFILGGVFAILWGGAIALGRKIEREKREAWHQWLVEQQGGQANA